MAGNLSNKHVFISYARGDGTAFAEALRERLNTAGYTAWLDTRSIEAGHLFYDEIREALQQAFVIVVVLTPGAVASNQVTAEWNYALSRFTPPIIPLVIADCEVPYTLEIFNYIDCRYDGNATDGMDNLIRRLAALEHDHHEYLERKLQEYAKAEQSAHQAGAFGHKVSLLKAALASWRAMFQTPEERTRLQIDRINAELQAEQTRLADSSRERLRMDSRKVVGSHVLDVSTHFRDRETQCKQLGQLLSDPATRIVSVVGRGGIGKTGLVSKVLFDLESDTWTHTHERIPVSGIIYLSTRTRGISLERLYFDCAEMLGGETEQELVSIWTNSQMSIGDKVTRLLSEMKQGLYIILFDNMEDLLDGDRQIADKDLQTFFDTSLRMPHNARLLVTTRVPINFPREVMRFDHQIVLDDGLPIDHAIQMLRDLDPSGDYGLALAEESDLAAVARLVKGVPRAIEVVASILANDPFTTLDELIESNELFKREEFVEALVETNYERLDHNSRRVMEALAVFGRPIPMVAIDYLLQPHIAGLDTRTILTRLIQTHAVSFDRKTKTVSLHPIDRDYIYSQIPE